MDFCSPQASMFKKTKMCAFILSAGCRNGTECCYAHDYSELHSAPDLRKSTLCINHDRGRCYLKDCKFAHGWGELKTPSTFPYNAETTDPTWQYALGEIKNINTAQENPRSSVVISINQALSFSRRPLSLFNSLTCDEVETHKEADALLLSITKEILPLQISIAQSLNNDDEGDTSPWRLPR